MTAGALFGGAPAAGMSPRVTLPDGLLASGQRSPRHPFSGLHPVTLNGNHAVVRLHSPPPLGATNGRSATPQLLQGPVARSGRSPSPVYHVHASPVNSRASLGGSRPPSAMLGHPVRSGSPTPGVPLGARSPGTRSPLPPPPYILGLAQGPAPGTPRGHTLRYAPQQVFGGPFAVGHVPPGAPPPGAHLLQGARLPFFGLQQAPVAYSEVKIRAGGPSVRVDASQEGSRSEAAAAAAVKEAAPAGMVLSNIVREEDAELAPGVEVSIGTHRLRCLEMLGSGSYSVVWQAKVLSVSKDGADCGQPKVEEPVDVALKDVRCRTHSSLQQSLFEVQLLLEIERKVLVESGGLENCRLPRCLSYKVGVIEEGWCVRTVMTHLPGEQLDGWLRRSAVAASNAAAVPSVGGQLLTWTSLLRRGCELAASLVKQIGPTLEQMAPLAWHRDVNSHNILVSDLDGSQAGGGLLDPLDSGAGAAFWLCDLGLAVDARNWVSEENSEGAAWKYTDIGGDCRYWPPSSWMVHCYGPEYLESREAFCRQYQTRLDVHGLGITAVEVLCTTAAAARALGVPPAEAAPHEEPWLRLMGAWQIYSDCVAHWWELIYQVFAEGGDFGPVHSWLCKEEVPNQVIALLLKISEALHACAAVSDDDMAVVLRALSELISETSELSLSEVALLLGADPPSPRSAHEAGSGAASPSRGAPDGAAADAASPKQGSRRCDGVAPERPPKTERSALPTSPGAAKSNPPSPVVAISLLEGALGEDLAVLPETQVQLEAQRAAKAAAEVAAATAAAAVEEGRAVLKELLPLPPCASAVEGASPLGAAPPPVSRERLPELVEVRERLCKELGMLRHARLKLEHAKGVCAGKAPDPPQDRYR